MGQPMGPPQNNGQGMMGAGMGMMPPRAVQTMPPPSRQGQAMPIANPGYGNGGEIMMVLSGANGQPYQLRDFPQMQGTSPNREFSMDHSDFPALSGGPGGSAPPPNAAGNVAPPVPTSMQRKEPPSMMAHYAQQASVQPPYARSYAPAPAQAPVPSQPRPLPQQQPQPQLQQPPQPLQRDETHTQYGLLGLRVLIRMEDRDLNTLALGTDLTTLGLNLNSTEPLYSSFASPWAENPANKDPHHLPESYAVPGLTPPAQMLQQVQDSTLLYAFYTTPRDMLQLQCARELFKRGWM